MMWTKRAQASRNNFHRQVKCFEVTKSFKTGKQNKQKKLCSLLVRQTPPKNLPEN